MGGYSFRVRGVDGLLWFIARLPRGRVRWKGKWLEVLLVRTQAFNPGSGALCSPLPTPFSFRNPGLPSSCSSLHPYLRRAGIACARLLPSHHANGALPSSPPETNSLTTPPPPPVIVIFSLLNGIKLVLFHTPKDSSPGNVRGEENCREEAIIRDVAWTSWN